MKKSIIFFIFFTALLLIFLNYTDRNPNGSSQLEVKETVSEISEKEFIESIAISEDIAFEVAEEQYKLEMESIEDNPDGYYSYVRVETTFPYYQDEEYSATIVGNYEIYTSGTNKVITDCVFYSYGSDDTWIQTTKHDSTNYPGTSSSISITGYFKFEERRKTTTSETIQLTQSFSVNEIK